MSKIPCSSGFITCLHSQNVNEEAAIHFYPDASSGTVQTVAEPQASINSAVIKDCYCESAKAEFG